MDRILTSQQALQKIFHESPSIVALFAEEETFSKTGRSILVDDEATTSPYNDINQPSKSEAVTTPSPRENNTDHTSELLATIKAMGSTNLSETVTTLSKTIETFGAYSATLQKTMHELQGQQLRMDKVRDEARLLESHDKFWKDLQERDSCDGPAEEKESGKESGSEGWSDVLTPPSTVSME